ncbi:RNA recognition domain-containing protein [Colletotrichum orchidophilum]|uniref:RNA recognition domain-containing protein n=1 Tax=Colletotrichum orchidophilum TaxID=1209926 RepID=A0A1G4BM95_9PEZI|nr:RNA recognition domain-containing protein [Colletotrichum orchidophilum]OHF02428.1 RNA recognition domain-containing protein [Colletotrichum orchidophilum]
MAAPTSAAAAVAELEAALEPMQNYKAPGVTGNRIATITTICVDNIKNESVLIQKLYTTFKKFSAPYKLGVLYVIDSVMRKWLDRAKLHGQPVDGSADDGSFGAGCHRITGLMHTLISDLVQLRLEGQKEKLLKLLEIWRRVQTFSPDVLEDFHQKIESSPDPIQSYTPEGSPPPGLVEAMGYRSNPVAAPSAQAPAADANSIIANLAKLTQSVQSQNDPQTQGYIQPQHGAQSQNNGHGQNFDQGHNYNQGQGNNHTQAAYSQPQRNVQSPVPTQTQTPAVPQNLQDLLSRLQSSTPHQQQQPPPPMPPVNQLHQAPYSVPPFPGGTPNPAAPYAYTQGQNQAPPVGQPFPGAVPQLPQVNAQQMALIQMFANSGLTADQITAALAAVSNQNGAAFAGLTAPTPSTTSAQAPIASQSYYTNGQGWGGPVQPSGNSEQSRYNDGVRSPNRYQGRSRSRSPGRRWNSGGSSRGRDNGFDHGRRSPDRDRRNSREGRYGSDYRQRSPHGSHSAARGGHGDSRRGSDDKWVDYDRNLKSGHIKVLSRTLFVGGVNQSEHELRAIFSRFGQVQTCIVNKDKRHAFVKMVSREDAVHAKDGMEMRANGNMPQNDDEAQLRTRWGVGFGPRDCSDYRTGVSVIPINKLTEADRKWMLTAEYGGSGGRPIEEGMVVEEPDIEIGNGVSSKAISRRMQTDKSGNHGPRSTRGGGRDDSREDLGRWRRSRDRDHRRDDKKFSSANSQPLPQQFPYGIGTLPNGMPAYPPGFAFPAAKDN